MINPSDLYKFHIEVPIIKITSATPPTTKTIGTTIITYEIRSYKDLRNLSLVNAYRVTCTQRIVIPNTTNKAGLPSEKIYSGYPAIIKNQIKCLSDTLSDENIELINYSPRTLNSAIVSSTASGTGTNATTSMQTTNGSSNSQSNTYDASVSLGIQQRMFSGDASISFSHTSGSETSSSLSKGNGTGHDTQANASETMSIKDWGCFSHLDVNNTSPTWIFGQQNPWNVLLYNNSYDTANIILPSFVQALLTNGPTEGTSAIVLPPSELSLLGVDFIMKAEWNLPYTTDTITFSHTIHYHTATHGLKAGEFSASIGPATSFSYATPTIDLCTYGLDPIFNSGAGAVAIAGFTPSHFLIPPVPASGNPITPPTAFKFVSELNNLLIADTTLYSTYSLTQADVGAGFSTSDTALTATFTQNCATLVIMISFKVIDVTTDYLLHLKHWITGSVGVALTIVINGTTSNPIGSCKPITKYVDSVEAGGGERNLQTISLRDLDFGSVNYHDYLQLGLNTIQITMTPISGSSANCGYQIRAISIEGA